MSENYGNSLGLQNVLGRNRPGRDPFAAAGEEGAIVGDGHVRAAVMNRVRTMLLEGQPDDGERIAGTPVSTVTLKRFLARLEDQAKDRDTRIGRQAHRMLSFLQKNKGGDQEMVHGVSVRQFRKFLRMLDRDAPSIAEVKAQRGRGTQGAQAS